MKKTMVFENETAYDNWFDVNEEKEGGHDFLENRVVIIKETRTINGKKFNGFSADSTIECKNVRTAVRRFVKELNSNGFEVSVDDFECSFNAENLHDLTGSGMVIEVEEIDDGRYYVNYMCYQDEVEEEIETEDTTEESEATETEPETATDPETAEAEETTDPEVGKFVYDVRIHNDYGWDTYTVRADGLESAEYKAVRRMELETDEEEYSSIDVIRIYKEDSNELLKEIISKEREDPETAEAEETTDPEVGSFVYDVVIHNMYGCDTYTVRADGLESAKDKALQRMKHECLDEYYNSIDSVRIYEENSDELLKEIIFEPTELEPIPVPEESVTETEKKTEIAIDTLINGTTKTTESTATESEFIEREKLLEKEKIPELNNFYKAIIKALGINQAKEFRYTIQGVNVFFEYKGNMYKCYTPQSKLFKLSGQRFNLISWRDLKKESGEKSDDNSGVIYTARSPPESSLLNLSINKLMKREDFFKMNKFIIKGYIGNIESGKNYTKVSIATTRNFKNKDGEYETDWFNCVAFNSTSDFISNYFSKGDMILCEGNIQNDNFTDDDGHIHYGFSFIIQSVEFCGRKNSEKQENNSRYGKAVNNKYKKK